jgi:hypothetical protein
MTLAENTLATTTARVYRTEFKSEPAEVNAGETVALVFTIRNAEGEVVRNLQIVHEQAMHLLIISDDLSEFYHLHPKQEADGSFRVTHLFPRTGNYWLYVDYTPDTHQVVDQLSLQIRGEAREAIALVEDESTTKTVDGLRVTMKSNQPLRAGEAVMLDFAVEDEQTNEPVADLQPYLGALAHFVIISENGAEFLHVHPMEPHEVSTAHSASHAVISPAHHQQTQSNKLHTFDSSATQISAHTSFPHAGLYKIWAQFQRHGLVMTVPFVVRVAERETL